MNRFLSVLSLALASTVVVDTTHGGGATTTRTRPFKQPPYYRGEVAQPVSLARLPVAVATESGVPASWLPTAALERLAGDLEQFLAGRLPETRVLVVERAGRGDRPATVYFGCELDAIEECDADTRQNVLATSGGSRGWKGSAASAASAAGADHVLIVQVRLTPWWIHQKNLAGKKEVRLGVDRSQPLPWLTSLDSPVWVLHVTGALVDGSGRVVRSGAEGVWAVRTPFRASVVGAERLMAEEDIERVRTERAWQAAADRLVRELTGR